MEAFWVAATQAFWWVAMFLSAISLGVMVLVLIFAILHEYDKEKLAETKETR